MSADIHIYETGGVHPIHELRHDPSTPGSGDAWENASIVLARREAEALAAHRQIVPVDVCIHLPGDQLSERLDRNLLQDLLHVARNHIGGPNLYLVGDRKVDLDSEVHVEASVARWFDVVLQGGVTDILQVSAEAATGALFRGARDRSRERMQTISQYAHRGPWKCELHKHAERPTAFLRPFVAGPPPAPAARSVIRVLTEGVEKAQVTATRQAKRHWEQQLGMIATVGVARSNRLVALCDEYELPVLAFQGWFELRYALQCLNALEAPSPAQVPMEHVTQVDLVDHSTFGRSVPARAPNMLVTGAFQPDLDSDHWIDAERDIGRLLDGLPFGVDREIRRAINCVMLSKLVEQAPRRTVWVYLGHGDDALCLEQTTSNANYRFAHYTRWLASFQGKGRSLALAFFSACKSSAVARRFAEEGVGVAIGFEREVMPEACRILSAPVVHAALRSGGDQQEIIKAFRDGCAQLTAADYRACLPRAFYAPLPM